MPWAITTAGCGPAPSGRYSQASSSSPEAVGIRTVVRRGTEALFFKFVIAGSYLLSPNRCWGVLIDAPREAGVQLLADRRRDAAVDAKRGTISG